MLGWWRRSPPGSDPGLRPWPASRTVRRHRLSPPARRRRHFPRRPDRRRHRHLRRDHVGPVIQAAGLLAPSPSRTRPLRRHPVRPGDRRGVRSHLYRAGPVHGGTSRRRRPAAPDLLRRPNRRRGRRGNPGRRPSPPPPRAPSAPSSPPGRWRPRPTGPNRPPVSASPRPARAGVSGRSSGVVDTGRRPPRRQPDHDRGDRLPAVIGPGSVAHDPVGLGISGRLAGRGDGRSRSRPARDGRRHRPRGASPPRGASSPRREAPPP